MLYVNVIEEPSEEDQKGKSDQEMKETNITDEAEKDKIAMHVKAHAKKARKKQLIKHVTVVVILAAVITAAFTGYYMHQEQKKTKKSAEAQKEEQLKETEVSKMTPETEAQKIDRKKKKAQKHGYPKGVIELLDKNAETVDFVADYEQKKDNPVADTIGVDLPQGGIPELLQWDERWGYAPYGSSMVAVSGCGPTCMAMVAAGLNQDETITPAKVAAYGTQHGYVDANNDTYWKFMNEAGANWNLKSQSCLLNEEQLSKELSQGHPVICSMGPGDFTKEGHFIVMTGYENGNIKINDPFSIKNTNATWTYAQIKDQVKAMWVFTKK